MSKYNDLMLRLFRTNMFTPAKLGLTNQVRLVQACGHPEMNYPIVHVAGTNGKGSVCWKVAQAAQRSGIRTGLFVSPHISCYRERIRVDGQPMSEEDVCALLPHVLDTATRENIHATFFEYTTALALAHFARANAELVVLEVGLGGRLDSTNVVTPAVSVITSIAKDHTRVLGSTLSEIAREKAGIIKQDVPVVLGPRAWSQPVILHRAGDTGSRVVKVQETPEAAADFDIENTAIATAVVNLLRETVPSLKFKEDAAAAGLASRAPCRFEVFDCRMRVGGTEAAAGTADKTVPVVLDVGHNKAALARLVRALSLRFPSARRHIVIGMSRDKDVAACLRVLARDGGDVASLHLVESSHKRAAKLAALREGLDHVSGETGSSDSEETSEVSARQALGPDATICEYPATGVWGDALGRGVGAAVRAAMLGSSGAADGDPKATVLEATPREPDAAASVDTTPVARSAPDKEVTDVVVVCGSVYLMSEARHALGINEPRDDPHWEVPFK